MPKRNPWERTEYERDRGIPPLWFEQAFAVVFGVIPFLWFMVELIKVGIAYFS